MNDKLSRNWARFENALSQMPLVAILRGVTPTEAAAVGEALMHAGIRIIEVPFNSPDAPESIRLLVDQVGHTCFLGGGTVLEPIQVDAVFNAGGGLIVSPNTNTQVIHRTLKWGGISVPGIGSASEAFEACAAGARLLKLFPASTYGPSHVHALRAVLPADVRLLGVGGISGGNIGDWMKSGIVGVGMGSDIYRAGDSPEIVFEKAQALVAALHRGN